MKKYYFLQATIELFLVKGMRSSLLIPGPNYPKKFCGKMAYVEMTFTKTQKVTSKK